MTEPAERRAKRLGVVPQCAQRLRSGFAPLGSAAYEGHHPQPAADEHQGAAVIAAASSVSLRISAPAFVLRLLRVQLRLAELSVFGSASGFVS